MQRGVRKRVAVRGRITKQLIALVKRLPANGIEVRAVLGAARVMARVPAVRTMRRHAQALVVYGD